MKKSLIISIGIILLLLVLTVWMYLLFFGTPKNGSDVFSNLGFETTSRPPASELIDTTPAATTETATSATIDTSKALNQLTLRPVAGFGFVGTSSSIIRYIERGTGHIFEIDTGTGSEKRISGTTIPRVVEGSFSESGDSVVLEVELEGVLTVYAGRIDTKNESVDYLALPSGAAQPGLFADDTVRYIRSIDIGTEGYEINIDSGQSTRLFSVPLRDITLIWGEQTYLYNKPTRYAEGSLYQIDDRLTPILPPQFGFVAGVGDQHYLTSYNTNDTIVSYAHSKDDVNPVQLATSYVPEKCAITGQRMWCAAPYLSHSGSFLEAWYRGNTQSEDLLWVIDLQNGTAETKANFLSTTGRAVDVDRIKVGSNGQSVAFRNKIDNTLWMYDSRN